MVIHWQCLQDRIRALHRELLKQIRLLYSAPRLLDMLVQGLSSKNNRTRVEAAEAIGEILQDEGVSVTDKAKQKPLPMLAQVSIMLLVNAEQAHAAPASTSGL